MSEGSGEIDLKAHKPSRADMSERIAVHDVQLQNGQKAFTELRNKVAELEAQARPKPIGPPHVFGAIGIIVTLAGAVWTLSFLFADRPTREQVKEVIDQQRSGITEQARDVKALREDVVRQGVVLDNVKAQITETSHKIDRLIDVSWKSRTKTPASSIKPPKAPTP